MGGMGHASSIAMGIAMNTTKKVWIIDGDGASLMHMGSMALLGQSGLNNIVHVIINNASHESVGGMPTVADKIDFGKIAEGCGYKNIMKALDEETLADSLISLSEKRELSCLEVNVSIGARADLGRPTSSPKENKEEFMRFLAVK